MNKSDVYALVSFVVLSNPRITLRDWEKSVGMSRAALARSLKQLTKSKLIVETVDGAKPNLRNIEEFLLCGFPYVFPAEKGKLVRGFSTGIDGSSLKNDFVIPEYPDVWAHHEGNIKGFAIESLHKAIPELVAAGRMPQSLYELLALLDVLRTGQRREVEAAQTKIKELLRAYEQ
jgi:DNA-binding Lrp family transcriptional regulator